MKIFLMVKELWNKSKYFLCLMQNSISSIRDIINITGKPELLFGCTAFCFDMPHNPNMKFHSNIPNGYRVTG